MASNNQDSNWVAMGLAFSGCVILGIAIGQMVDDGSWIAIGLGAGFLLSGLVHALYLRKPR